MRFLCCCCVLLNLMGCPKGPDSSTSQGPTSKDTTPQEMPPVSDATPESGSTLSPEASSLPEIDWNLNVQEQPELDVVATAIVDKPIYTYAAKTVTYSPDGKLIAVGTGQGKVHLYDSQSHEHVRTIQAHENWAFDLVFSVDSQQIYTGGGDNLSKIWNMSDGKESNSFADHLEDVHGVAVNGAGELLFSGADDMQVLMRSLKDETVTVIGKHDLQVTGVSLSPDETLLASSSRDNTVKIFDLKSLQEPPVKEPLTFKNHTAHVLSAAFSHDSQKVVSIGNDMVARIWDPKTGKELETFKLLGYGYAAIFSKDDQAIFTGTSDGLLHMFKLGTQESAGSLQLKSDISDLSLSPEGDEVAAVTSGGELILVKISGDSLSQETRIELPGAPRKTENTPE